MTELLTDENVYKIYELFYTEQAHTHFIAELMAVSTQYISNIMNLKTPRYKTIFIVFLNDHPYIDDFYIRRHKPKGLEII